MSRRFAVLGLVSLAVIVAVSSASGAPARRAGARPAAKPESLQVLVRLGRESITRADVQHRIDDLPEQFRANYSTPEGRQQILDRMVEERVWWMAAQKAGVASRAAIQRQLEQQRRDLIIRTFVNEVMAANGEPSDAETRAYYDQHLAEYRIPATVTLRHIQLRTESEAKRVLGFARGREDWNKLAQKFSLDTLTKASGGQLGTVTREGVFASIGRQPALAESAFALGEGRLGGPWKTDRGWHVVKVDQVKPESMRAYDQVRPMIVRQMGATRSQDFYRTRLDSLKRAIGVTPDSAAIKGFVSQRKTARELFKEAQDAGPAATRIDLYRKLLADYPNDEVSPQAAFMIGFVWSEELKNYDEAERAFRDLLKRYPKSELASSAQWMIDHMRTEDAPAFLDAQGDTLGASRATGSPKRAPAAAKKGTDGKP